jgi:hypothetical protein
VLCVCVTCARATAQLARFNSAQALEFASTLEPQLDADSPARPLSLMRGLDLPPALAPLAMAIDSGT